MLCISLHLLHRKKVIDTIFTECVLFSRVILEFQVEMFAHVFVLAHSFRLSLQVFDEIAVL